MGREILNAGYQVSVRHCGIIEAPIVSTRTPTLWGISASDTKYFHILAALDQETAMCLLELISQPPAEYKYKELKD